MINDATAKQGLVFVPPDTRILDSFDRFLDELRSRIYEDMRIPEKYISREDSSLSWCRMMYGQW